MVSPKYIQTEFLIPIRRDSELSDGGHHPAEAWDWLRVRLWEEFGGSTKAPGLYEGFYRDPDTGARVHDKSRKYIVALPKTKLKALCRLLEDSCWIFQQKCIYLNVAGQVQFIELPKAPRHESKRKKPP